MQPEEERCRGRTTAAPWSWRSSAAAMKTQCRAPPHAGRRV